MTCSVITGQRHTLLHGWGRHVPTQAKSSQTVLLKGAAICYNSVPEKSQLGLWLLGGGPGSPPPDWHLEANAIKWLNHPPLQNPLLWLPASVFAPSHLVFFFFSFFDAITLLWELIVFSFPHMYNTFIFTIYLFMMLKLLILWTKLPARHTHFFEGIDLEELNYQDIQYIHINVAQSLSCVWLFTTLWTVACQALLSMEFSKQEYWSVLPFPRPGTLPNPGIEPMSFVSPAFASRFFTSAMRGR